MNILVLGGSYFLGRYFVNMSCQENSIFVFNRGNCSINLPGVTQITGDRHKETDLNKLSDYDFDIVVDFCAYKKGDIYSVIEALKSIPMQYIFVSTVDVYMHGTGAEISEEGAFETRSFAGPEGEYIAGKIELEKEIRAAASEYGINYTVMRPAFIYGPGNYAPREEIYLNWIKQAGQILHPTDATGEFQMVYVRDVAAAIVAALNNEKAFNQAYNLTGEKTENYISFSETLSKVVSIPFERIDIDVATVNEKGIPLPFPLTKEESNWYKGEKVLELIGQYTSFEEGLSKTANSSLLSC